MSSVARRESWKEIHLGVRSARTRYAVSDAGRVCSFREKPGDGRLLRGTLVNGYPALKLKIAGKDIQCYVHKLVARYFLRKPVPARSFVIHLDHDKQNNRAANLRWVDRDAMQAHQQDSPRVKAYRARTRTRGLKLTAHTVRRIKRLIFDQRRTERMKDIAYRFGISEMQLYRIRSGENWGHIRP